MPLRATYGALKGWAYRKRPVFTTLDPVKKPAAITLSADKLTATLNAGGQIDTAAATVTKSTGKYYCEITFNTTANKVFGIGLDSYNWANGIGNVPGAQAADHSGMCYIGGALTTGGSSVMAVAGAANGDVFCMAVDLNNGRLWVKKAGGLWNASGTADPATNVGGADLSTLTAGSKTPFIAPGGTLGDNNTINFGAALTPFVNAMPSGFSEWA